MKELTQKTPTAQTRKKFLEPGKWYTRFDETGSAVEAVYEPSYRRILGFESEEEYKNAQETWINAIHPNDSDRVNEHMAEVLKADPAGPDFDIEYRMMTASGWHWFHDFAHCVRRPDGTVSEAFGTVFDINSQVTTDEINKQVIEDYFAVSVADLDAHTITTLKKSPYFKYDDPSPVHPYTESLLTLGSLISDESGIFFKKIADPAYVIREFGSENKLTFSFRSKSPGIEDRWVTITAYVLKRDAAGQVRKFTLHFSLTDPAEVRNLELNEQLEAEARIAEQMSRAAGVSKWLYHIAADDTVLDFTILNISGRFDTEYAQQRPDNWLEFLHPDDRAPVLEAFYAAIRDHTCKTPYNVTYRLIDKTGTCHWFRSTGNIQRNADGSGEFYGFLLNIDNEQEKTEAVDRLTAISGYLMSSYASVYYCGYKDGVMVFYADETLRGILKKKGIQTIPAKLTGDYTTTVSGAFADAFVEEEGKTGAELFDEKTMRARLAKEPYFTFQAKIDVGQGIRSFRVHITRGADADHFVVGFMDITREIEEEQRRRVADTENTQRVLSLADNLESYYDIDMATREYEYVIKNKSGYAKVNENQVLKSDFFADTHRNTDAVVFEEDRAMLKDMCRPEKFVELLKDRPFYDWYVRIYVGDKPVWFRDRIAWRDAAKTHILLGVFNATEEMEAREKLEANSRRILALADNFETLYDIDFETGEYVAVSRAASLTEKISDALLGGKDFFAGSAQDVEKFVFEEDKAALRPYATREKFREVLHDRPYCDYYYRLLVDGKYVWFRNRAAWKDADKKRLIIGVFNADAEIAERRRQTEQQASIDRLSSISSYLMESYTSVYYCGFEDGMTLLHLDGVGNELVAKALGIESLPAKVPGDYAQAVKSVAGFALEGEDRDTLSRFLEAVYVRRRLVQDESFTFITRAEVEGEIRSYRVHVTRGADVKHYALGFADITNEARAISGESELMMRLYGDIDVLFVIDPESGAYDIYTETTGIIEDVTVLRKHGNNFYTDVDLIEKFQIHDEDKKQFGAVYNKPNLLKIAKTGEMQTTENRWLIEGEYLWKLNKLVRRIEPDGKISIIIGVWDTTETKKKEEAEREQKKSIERLRAISSYLMESYTTVYYAGYNDGVTLVHLNTYGKEYFGRTLGVTQLPVKIADDFAAANKQLTELTFTGAEKENFAKIFTEANLRKRLAKEPSFIFNTKCSLFDDTRMYRVHIARGADADHFAIGFVDITEETEKAEEQKKLLSDALAVAESANHAKSAFLFSMSHDVRTPMNAILGFTNMALKNQGDEEKVRDCLEKTKKSGNLLLSLINSVLDMSRIESGNARLEEKPGDVLYSFVNIETTLKEIAKSKDIDLSFGFGEVKDRYVFVDYDRTSRVMVNLITNAIKYTKAGGFVRVRCEQTGRSREYGTYRYTIEDNGIGMSEEFQKHMFEEFSREETSTTSGIQGTGLGLSVCKAFVGLMGGEISCKSKPGEGTTFTVILPFRLQGEGKSEYIHPDTGEKQGVETAAGNEPVYIDFTGRRVLLVEDNEMNREIAVDILTDEGLAVEEAEDGSIAVRMVKEHGPDYYDFVLMDIQMPVMDGYEATRAIRKLPGFADLPIIAVSANAFEEDRRTSLAAGMNDHVAKPIDVAVLMRALARFMK